MSMLQYASTGEVAPPRGERGLKSAVTGADGMAVFVAPPRGERGLKLWHALLFRQARHGRSPSWGAWIEILVHVIVWRVGSRRSPSWGAWIEIRRRSRLIQRQRVAPPRGERGLKSAWAQVRAVLPQVAPPRGERGLKS